MSTISSSGFGMRSNSMQRPVRASWALALSGKTGAYGLDAGGPAGLGAPRLHRYGKDSDPLIAFTAWTWNSACRSACRTTSSAALCVCRRATRWSSRSRAREVEVDPAWVRPVAGERWRRGVGGPEASPAAEAGVAVYRVALERWVDDASGDCATRRTGAGRGVPGRPDQQVTPGSRQFAVADCGATADNHQPRLQVRSEVPEPRRRGIRAARCRARGAGRGP